MIPTLLGITFVTFLIMNLAPGDPVSTRFASPEGGGEGDSGSRERMADAIKVKKKLLGIVREAHSVATWTSPPARGDEPAEMKLRTRGPETPGWPKAMALGASGTLWVGGADQVLRQEDLSSGKILRELPGHEQLILAIAASPDGSRVLSGDGDGVVRAWTDAGPAWSAKVAPLPVRDLALLPAGRALAAADDGSISVLSDSGSIAARWTGHVGGAHALAVSADGATAWSAGADRKVREWDVASGTVRRVVAEGGQVNDIVLSPDGTSLFSGGDDRRVWRLPLDGSPPVEIGQHYGPVTALAISPDGSALYSGGRDEILRRWDLPSGRLSALTAQALGPVWSIAPAPDGGVVTASDSWMPVPLPARYMSWLSRMLRLDFDRSFKDDRPVMEKLLEALRVTILLNAMALVLIYVIAVPLGVLAAAKRGSPFDHVSSIVLFLLYSIPSFWFATLLILAFSSKTAWNVLPAVGLHSPDHENLSYLSWLRDGAAHLVLPLTVMIYATFASLSRYARTSMLETIGQDYIRTARAKGLSERVVLWKHAFRNSLITIVTLVGNLLPAMIGGSVIVESIFSINGMGKLGFDSILARDYPTIMAITTFSALLTLLGILLSDILYTIVDPRITHR